MMDHPAEWSMNRLADELVKLHYEDCLSGHEQEIVYFASSRLKDASSRFLDLRNIVSVATTEADRRQAERVIKRLEKELEQDDE
jgi:hypothetical protein